MLILKLDEWITWELNSGELTIITRPIQLQFYFPKFNTRNDLYFGRQYLFFAKTCLVFGSRAFAIQILGFGFGVAKTSGYFIEKPEPTREGENE